MNCPVCKKPLEGPTWSDGKFTLCLNCADSLVSAVMDATEARYIYTRTIVGSLVDAAARRLEPPEVPPLLRLLEA